MKPPSANRFNAACSLTMEIDLSALRNWARRHVRTGGAQRLKRRIDGNDLVGAGIASGKKKLLHPLILRIVKQGTPCWRAIPSGPPRFLIIRFKICRHLIMNNKSDIAFVDSHAKGIGRHHHPAIALHEVLLMACAFLAPKLPVIERDLFSRLAQRLI